MRGIQTMSEHRAVERTREPLTQTALVKALQHLGLKAGDTVLVHASLSSLGWVIGQEMAVINALLDVLGAHGTLMMPAHTAGNSEPSNWENPPIPKAWWPLVREHAPAFDPLTSPTRGMGRIAELFRTYPNVHRSSHPEVSFAAHGPNTEALILDHAHSPMFGESSPLGALTRLQGKVLLLGVGYDVCTLLHLSEVQAQIRPMKRYGHAIQVRGKRAWATVRDYDYDDAPFEEIGKAFEVDNSVNISTVGLATCRLIDAEPLVDFGTRWLQKHLNRP